MSKFCNVRTLPVADKFLIHILQEKTMINLAEINKQFSDLTLGELKALNIQELENLSIIVSDSLKIKLYVEDNL
jgi:hypothetical protein